MRASRRRGLGLVSTFINDPKAANLLVALIVLGVLFWGDRLGPRLLVGGAMVLGGVLIVALRGRARQRALQTASD